jgi:hypothetical protein
LNKTLLQKTLWFYIPIALVIDPCLKYFWGDGIFDLRYFVTQTLSYIPTSFILAYISMKLSSYTKPIGKK